MSRFDGGDRRPGLAMPRPEIEDEDVGLTSGVRMAAGEREVGWCGARGDASGPVLGCWHAREGGDGVGPLGWLGLGGLFFFLLFFFLK